MWGVIAGLVLKSSRPEYEKLKLITVSGIIGVVLGFLLNPITPIIPRICSSSYTIESVGWSLLVLAFFYWIIDIKGYRSWTKFMVIYGVSPIFIYMYSQLLGSWTIEFIGVFTIPVIQHLGVAGKIIQQNLKLLAYWCLMYWLYKHKIIIKI